MMLNQNGQRNQQDGWQYDDGEGGYLKVVEQASVYILQESRSKWVLIVTDCEGEKLKDYAETLREAKRLAEYYLP